jgi:Domain of unknown function (DUF1929)
MLRLVKPGRFGARAIARAVRALSLSVAVAAGAPSGAGADNGVGAWSPLQPWPLIPIHAAILKDGRVLTFGTDSLGQQTGRFVYDVWNPAAGFGAVAHRTLANTTRTDLFCSAQAVLPGSGKVLLVGGDLWDGGATTNDPNNDSVVFDPDRDALVQANLMKRRRWYATATTLPSGETYIQGGEGGADLPEVRGMGGMFRLLTGTKTGGVSWYYPRNFVAPNGRIVGWSGRKMYTVNPSGAGALKSLGSMPADGPVTRTASEAMFAPGKILRVGGGAGSVKSTVPGTSAAAVIDINGATPTYRRVAPMPVGLNWPNATVLADGRVAVTGGVLLSNQLVGVNDRALLWDPALDSWTQSGPSSGRARMYHSVAILLRDGSVLVGGGGAPGPEANLNAEVYHPPYLFLPGGAERAPRPTITAAPARLTVGAAFTFTVAPAASIARVTLVKTGAVTHSFDSEQRFMELPILARTEETLTVQAPATKALAPPGTYFLFAIDDQGVPAEAAIVMI